MPNLKPIEDKKSPKVLKWVFLIFINLIFGLYIACCIYELYANQTAKYENLAQYKNILSDFSKYTENDFKEKQKKEFTSVVIRLILAFVNLSFVNYILGHETHYNLWNRLTLAIYKEKNDETLQGTYISRIIFCFLTFFIAFIPQLANVYDKSLQEGFGKVILILIISLAMAFTCALPLGVFMGSFFVFLFLALYDLIPFGFGIHRDWMRTRTFTSLAASTVNLPGVSEICKKFGFSMQDIIFSETDTEFKKFSSFRLWNRLYITIPSPITIALSAESYMPILLHEFAHCINHDSVLTIIGQFVLMHLLPAITFYFLASSNLVLRNFNLPKSSPFAVRAGFSFFLTRNFFRIMYYAFNAFKAYQEIRADNFSVANSSPQQFARAFLDIFLLQKIWMSHSPIYSVIETGYLPFAKRIDNALNYK